jgi:hypothetical protein
VWCAKEAVMKVDIQSKEESQEPHRDPVNEGFEELEKYLRSAPHAVERSRSEEAVQPSAINTDDPRHVGLDELERALKAARLGVNG